MSKELTQTHLRFLALRHFGTWYIVAIVFWIADLILYFKQPAPNREIPWGCTIGAIATTIICIIYGTYKIWRAVHLFREGMEVEGEVSGFGLLRSHGMVRVDCTYVVDGKKYTTASSEPSGRYDLGDKVAFIVDPRRPEICDMKSDIYPDYKDPSFDKPDSWKWWYYILAGVGFGAASTFVFIHPDFMKPGNGDHGMFVDLYNLVGGWGIAALFAIISLSCLWVGISQFKKQGR